VFFKVFVKCFFVSDNLDFFTCKFTPGLRDTSKRLSFSQRCSGKKDIKNVIVSESNMELCISSLGIKRPHTVKSSNFVTLLDENIFLHKTFLTSPHTFFRYWNLYRWGLCIGRGHVGLGFEISFFPWVTKLEDCHLISSPLTVT
jgi:hypothetical protein